VRPVLLLFAKINIFFRQSMVTQNGNFKLFLLIIQPVKTKYYFKKVYNFSCQRYFCTSKIEIIFSSSVWALKVVILYISIDPSFKQNKKNQKSFETLAARAAF
jgi:hypothetical protein